MARESANELVDPELLEFSEAGQGPAGADPVFAETLRQKLWKLLRQRLGGERGEDERLD